MEIRNKTKRPLSVPLPGGKKLFLGPGKTGQITAKAAEHAPLKALVEADELEILGTGHPQSTPSGGSGGSKGPSASHGTGGASGGMRHTGDR